MPAPSLRVRRSARTWPAKVRRATRARYSRRLRKASSNSSARAPRGVGLRAWVATAAPGLGRGLRHHGEEVVDDHVAVDALGLALEVEQDAVAQRRLGHAADVVDRDRV